MSLNQEYATSIALQATLIMVAATKQTSLHRTAAYHCREAQSLRRQLRGVA